METLWPSLYVSLSCPNSAKPGTATHSMGTDFFSPGGCRGLGREANKSSHLTRLRMNGAITPLPIKFSVPAQRRLVFSVRSNNNHQIAPLYCFPHGNAASLRSKTNLCVVYGRLVFKSGDVSSLKLLRLLFGAAAGHTVTVLRTNQLSLTPITYSLILHHSAPQSVLKC